MKCDVDYICDQPIAHWYIKSSMYSDYTRIFGYCNRHRPDVIRYSCDLVVRPLSPEEIAVCEIMND
jgi:hypothetical protein